jgi:hypothetical protein
MSKIKLDIQFSQGYSEINFIHFDCTHRAKGTFKLEIHDKSKFKFTKKLISTAVKYRHGDNYLKRPFLDIRNDHIKYVSDNRNRALREYTTEDVVRCLDSMAEQRNWRPIHIAFIGDSTIRQHFFSFLLASTSLIALSIIKS